jgi:hypothetical protein
MKKNNKNINKIINSFVNEYGITSDKQLLELAKKLNIQINYIGFIENLNNISKDGGYIINLANVGSGGSHWTSFYKEGDKLFYYDSFAVGFEDKLIELAHKSNIKTIIWNDYHQHQDITEEMCGIWVLLFLYHFQNSKLPFEERFKEFTKKYNFEDLNGDYSASL